MCSSAQGARGNDDEDAQLWYRDRDGGTQQAGARNAIQRVVGGVVHGDANRATVTMADGRVWRAVSDGSLSGSINGEVVSPILTYADLEPLQNVVRALRGAGARADDSCGIHIHVGAEGMDARALSNLIKMMNKHELIIEKALGVSEARLQRYCRRVNPDMMRRLETQRPRTLSDMNRVWYGVARTHADRYDSAATTPST